MNAELVNSELRGDSVLILGYGREGKSSHRYIAGRHPHLQVAVADYNSCELIAEASDSTIQHNGSNYLEALSQYDTIVRSPGIPYLLDEIQNAKAAGKHITSLSNIFMSEAPGRIIGVTGTKGKSTTATLIRDFLSRSQTDVRLLGNIGEPSLDALSTANADTVFVIEFSSFQLEDLRYSPEIAIVLPIIEEHLDHHRNFKNYLDAKCSILKHQNESNTAIIHRCLIQAEHLDQLTKARVLSYSEEATVGTLITKHIPRSELPLIGKGNFANIIAASIAAKEFGVSIEQIVSALKEFEPLEHRIEFVGEFNGVSYYNDSLATIPEATLNALDGLGDSVETLIVGGHDRGIAYDRLSAGIAERQRHLKNIVLLPDTGKKVAELLQKNRGTQCLFPADTLDEAVAIAVRETSSGKACLFSPAASSLNMFRDYKERGDRFKELVRS